MCRSTSLVFNIQSTWIQKFKEKFQVPGICRFSQILILKQNILKKFQTFEFLEKVLKKRYSGKISIKCLYQKKKERNIKGQILPLSLCLQHQFNIFLALRKKARRNFFQISAFSLDHAKKKDLAIFLSFSSLLAKLIVGQALAFFFNNS